MAALRERGVGAWDGVAAGALPDGVDAFDGGALRSVLRALDAVPDPRQKTAADLGCGAGTLLPELAARFRRVLGVDCSPATLARARATCRAHHVSFHRADLADLTAFRGCFDVAVTMNPTLAPDHERLDRIFDSIHAAVRPGGLLIAVFPAMEAVLYQGFLVHERERRGAGAPRVSPRPSGALECGKPDLVQMADASERDRGRKFFHEFELRHLLRRAGFRRLRLARVLCPWVDAPGSETFRGEPPPWDWLVRAESR